MYAYYMAVYGGDGYFNVTALHIAAYNNQLKAVEFLIPSGCDSSIMAHDMLGKKYTAKDIAEMAGHERVVSFLSPPTVRMDGERGVQLSPQAFDLFHADKNSIIDDMMDAIHDRYPPVKCRRSETRIVIDSDCEEYIAICQSLWIDALKPLVLEAASNHRELLDKLKEIAVDSRYQEKMLTDHNILISID